MVHRLYRALPAYILIFLVTVLATGCDGVNSSSNGEPTPIKASTSEVFVQANAGLIIAVRIGELAILDGSSSVTSSTDTLTYAWSFSSKPHASMAQLQHATSVNPSFIADVTGTYMVQLVVSAEGVSSQRAIATVEVSNPGDQLTGKRLHITYPSQCDVCHDGKYADDEPPFDPVLPKSGNHLATSNMCEACHTTFGFEIFRYADHLEVFGKCSACHNGVLAVGKSQFHVTTSAECSDCHTTISFMELGPDGKFDHTDITSGCADCHNGVVAIGQHESHIITDTDCSFCHNTVDFKDAFIDHSTISANCAFCHNGIDAIGQTEGHPVMLVECEVCHNITSFSLGGVFNHRLDPAVQPCAGCHTDDNSINARGKASADSHVETTADCGICHGLAGDSFADGVYDHTSIIDNCKACHGVGGDGSGPGKPVNHMPTALDCSVCHTPGSFTTGVFDHDMTVYNPPVPVCADCHDGVISVGKLITHIPTTPDDKDCADCHTSTDTFKGAIFDHTGISSNCASCHDGIVSTGKPAGHMPTSRDCSECHVAGKFDDFTGATYDHADAGSNCVSCHDGVIATGKSVDHIPALPECSQCHEDTSIGGFTASIFATAVHPDLAGGCEGCHVSRFFATRPTLVKAAGHLPTLQDCHFCHSNDTFSPHIFNHTGIADNCTSCHNGDYVDPAGALGKTPDHPSTTEDCGLCHSVSGTFADAIFDHTGRVDNCNECHADGATGAVTKKGSGHVPTSQDCSVCHIPGSFETAVFSHTGIVDNCASCHDGTAATATVKPDTHLPTTEDCSVCHNTTAFAGAHFDHTGIVANCVFCHDGTIALGKLTDHVPTTDDCSSCHQTTGFIPASFDHAGIVDNCVSCHDGVFAQGKSDGHILTGQDCGVCHNPSSFIPATFDHSDVTTSIRCDSCHGVTATGKPVDHLATDLDCRDCHTTATFAGGSWVHDAGTAGICKTCHSPGGGATPQPTSGHFETTVQCDACHTTDGWAPASAFDHCPDTTAATCPTSDYPGDHRRSLACTDCHTTSSQAVTYPSSRYAPFCAGCHERDFESTGDHIGGSSGTVEQNKDCSGGGRGCHKVTSSGF